MMHRGARDTGVCQRRGWPGEQLLLQKMLDTSRVTLPLCAQRGRNLDQLPEVTHEEGKRWT